MAGRLRPKRSKTFMTSALTLGRGMIWFTCASGTATPDWWHLYPATTAMMFSSAAQPRIFLKVATAEIDLMAAAMATLLREGTARIKFIEGQEMQFGRIA